MVSGQTCKLLFSHKSVNNRKCTSLVFTDSACTRCISSVSSRRVSLIIPLHCLDTLQGQDQGAYEFMKIPLLKVASDHSTPTICSCTSGIFRCHHDTDCLELVLVFWHVLTTFLWSLTLFLHAQHLENPSWRVLHMTNTNLNIIMSRPLSHLLHDNSRQVFSMISKEQSMPRDVIIMCTFAHLLKTDNGSILSFSAYLIPKQAQYVWLFLPYSKYH